MMVTFVSQCEKNALNKTRRVLDSFANRIGNRTWQTVITNEGLNAVKKLLNQTASKSTAVACHWQRSRGHSELVWIVGNRGKFNAQGSVPVHSTRKAIIPEEKDWHLLPLIESLTALAALFHDWGKASQCFQAKLKPSKSKKIIADPLRHEWVSCLLLRALVNGESDSQWLARLASGMINEQQLKQQAAQNCSEPLQGLPKVASLLAWLVLTHHRLPLPAKDSNEINQLKGWSDAPDFSELFTVINADFGYANRKSSASPNTCLTFPNGLPNTAPWLKQAEKWAVELHRVLPQLELAINNGSYRLVLHHARLSLMLGDHYYSSQDADKKWGKGLSLYANTDKSGKLKQLLDEHLVGVAKNALITARLLPAFEDEPPHAYDITKLKHKSKEQKFHWQDKAVEKIKVWRKKDNASTARYGFFAVNMASTGCGKTLANAKIMQALSKNGDSLRYALALGLRTLTLQTGDEYRERIGLNETELAVMIGSRAVQELHTQNQQTQPEDDDNEAMGSESAEELLDDNDVYYDCEIPETTLTTVLKDNRCKKFLYAPVLACTIDHLMAATETKRGGRYILPCLRLMSSDLVIDEIDDFDGVDLIAIGRLIHLAGMLGRKVMISSATIPPDLAEGYFNAYQTGWQLFAQTRDVENKIGCAWIDEACSPQIESIHGADINHYRDLHQHFITKRCGKLKIQEPKRIAEIVTCTPQNSEEDYFSVIQQAIITQHQRHAQTDTHTGKQVSFGVVRMANIPPCIHLTEYLAQADWSDSIDVRIMAYHSQQVLLLRSEQEKHLDAVLKRKDPQAVFNNPLICQHLHDSPADNLIFIVVATPVEEVGRDHDFDWAVVEPSSYRSIIQLAGRVLRHRDIPPKVANMALMQYNLKALKNQGAAYCRPGYESEKHPLSSHDLQDLIPSKQLAHINAIPRIQHNVTPTPDKNLADLEHASIHSLLTNYQKKGAETLQGWLTECWWFTALPQQLSPFRQQDKQINLYLMPDNQEGWVLEEKIPKGGTKPIEQMYKITHKQTLPPWHKKLWLYRNYGELLEQQAEDKGLSMYHAALRYGEISVPVYHEDDLYNGNGFDYSDQLGLCKK
ncbi:MAG: type I-F CRISPR-associated helicase Cas3f [Methylococcaceae bacterium]|nr:type I-F CRISPR-associated helicase Cas3f [Methylococcaceae bacterium]